jgi:hypothetical protein
MGPRDGLEAEVKGKTPECMLLINIRINNTCSLVTLTIPSAVTSMRTQDLLVLTVSDQNLSRGTDYPGLR